MVLITIVTGAYKPTNITGGPHIDRIFTWASETSWGIPRPPSGFNTKSCYDDWMMTVVPRFFFGNLHLVTVSDLKKFLMNVLN